MRLIGLAVVLSLLAPPTEAQQTGKIYRVGLLTITQGSPDLMDGFRQGLREHAGTMECNQIPGHTRGPLKVAFFLRIGGGQVEYERWHVRPAAAGLDPTERGTGTVSSTGEVSLTSETGE
jgi:hypothetical protein